MTDFPHPTPKPEADLAGVPRPVSTEDVQLMAAMLDDMIANPWSASAMLLVLVSERDALAVRVRELEAALRGCIDFASGQLCLHEDTYRGGAIWEICRTCGAKWADDEGGRPEWVEPKQIIAARAALTTPESKP